LSWCHFCSTCCFSSILILTLASCIIFSYISSLLSLIVLAVRKNGRVWLFVLWALKILWKLMCTLSRWLCYKSLLWILAILRVLLFLIHKLSPRNTRTVVLRRRVLLNELEVLTSYPCRMSVMFFNKEEMISYKRK